MDRKNILYLILGAFFVTNAVFAELVGGKVILVAPADFRIGPLGPFLMSVGVIPWPVVFIVTDLTNEYFGRKGVRRLTLFTAGLIVYVFVILLLTMKVPAQADYGVDDKSYNAVFGQSLWIIVGSIVAFLVAQLVDVFVFHVLRRRTGKAMLWLRATGSTVISQFFDSFIVLWIGLAWPRGWDLGTYLGSALTNYSVKLGIAIGLTPVIYLGHWLVERYLGKDRADALAEEAAAAS